MADQKTDQQYARTFYSRPAEKEPDLGPLAKLPGTWKAKGTGWNMIALPFKDRPPRTPPYRVLMNQYDEVLTFSFVDDNVPNRGVAVDQRVAALDYQQKINQIAVEDCPASKEKGGEGAPIHHEPGLFIRVKDHPTNKLNIARLASIPHGNSVLALGESKPLGDMPPIPPLNALPLGRFEDHSTPDYDVHTDRYLAPYKHFIDKPFMGKVKFPGFPGFEPLDMTSILNFANQGLDFRNVIELPLDTMVEDAGVHNMPFTVREAEPVSMRSTFWIQEVRPKNDPTADWQLRMQYVQVVMLDFFAPREDGMPGRIQWPHVSIATLVKEPDAAGGYSAGAVVQDYDYPGDEV